jgi:hypothetical protein
MNVIRQGCRMSNLSAVSRDEWRFDRNRCRSRPRPKPTVVDQERATVPRRFADIHDQVSANVSFLYGRVSFLDPQGSSNCPHNGHSIYHFSHDRPISRDEPGQRTSASIGHARHGGLFAKCDGSDDLYHRLGVSACNRTAGFGWTAIPALANTSSSSFRLRSHHRHLVTGCVLFRSAVRSA